MIFTTYQGCAEGGGETARGERQRGVSVRNDGIAGDAEKRTAESGVRIIHMIYIYMHTCRHTDIHT